MSSVDLRFGTTGPERHILKERIHAHITGLGWISIRKGTYVGPPSSVDQIVKVVHAIYEIEAKFPDTKVGNLTVTSGTLISIYLRRSNFGYTQRK